MGNTSLDHLEFYTFRCHVTSGTKYPIGENSASSYILASMGTNIFISIPTVILNAVVMVAIFKTPGLHTPSNFILFNTAISDLCNGLLSSPLFSANYLAIFIDQKHNCALFIIMMASIHFFSLLSFWLILLVGIDRHIAIFKPYFYHEKVVAKIEVYIYIVIVLYLVNGAIMAISFYCAAFNVILAFEGASLFIIVLYSSFTHVKIYFKVRNVNWKIHIESNRQSDSFEETVKNKSLKRHETRIALLTFFMLASIVICYIPFAVVVFSWWAGEHGLWQTILNMWGFTFILFKSLLNPLIYCYSLTSIRKAIKGILRCNKMK